MSSTDCVHSVLTKHVHRKQSMIWNISSVSVYVIHFNRICRSTYFNLNDIRNNLLRIYYKRILFIFVRHAWLKKTFGYGIGYFYLLFLKTTFNKTHGHNHKYNHYQMPLLCVSYLTAINTNQHRYLTHSKI